MHDLLALLAETRCFVSPTNYETFQARRCCNTDGKASQPLHPATAAS